MSMDGLFEIRVPLIFAVHDAFIKIEGYCIWQPFPPSRILKPYVYSIQINNQTFLNAKCLRICRAQLGLFNKI